MTSAVDLEDAVRKAVASVSKKCHLHPDPLGKEFHFSIRRVASLITVKEMVVSLGGK